MTNPSLCLYSIGLKSVAITNQADEKITVTDADGKTVSVAKDGNVQLGNDSGQKNDNKKDESTSTSSGSSSGGSSSGSSSGNTPTPAPAAAINPVPDGAVQITDLNGLEANKTYVLTQNATAESNSAIPAGTSVYIPANVTLTIPSGVQIKNEGSLITSTSSYASTASVSGRASLRSTRARIMGQTAAAAGKINIADESNTGISGEKKSVLKFTSFTDLESQSQTGVIVVPSMELWIGTEKYIADSSAKMTVKKGSAGWFINGDGKLCLCILDQSNVQVNQATEVYSYIVKGTCDAAATLTLTSWECYTDNNFVAVEPSGTLAVGEETIIGPADEATFKVNVPSDGENENKKCLRLCGKNADRVKVGFSHPDVIDDQWVTITKDNTNNLYELDSTFTEYENKWTIDEGVNRDSWIKMPCVVKSMGTFTNKNNEFYLYLNP